MEFDVKKVEESITYVILSRCMYLSILNRLGLNHDWDRQRPLQ